MPVQTHAGAPSAPDVWVYASLMSSTNKDIDDEACAAIMKRYRMAAKRGAVDFALRFPASEAFRLEEARGMRGSGWDGDLGEMRERRTTPR